MTRNTKSKIDEALNYIQNDTLKAIEILDEILKNEPENIDAINGKGSALMKFNLMDEAEKIFDYSLSLKKTSSALISKGIINKNKKNYKEALTYYDEAIQLNPDLNNIINHLKNEIIGLINEDSELELDNLTPEINELIEKGTEYKNSNKLWDALDYYKKAIELDSNCLNCVQPLIDDITAILHHELKIKIPKFRNSKTNQLKLKSLRLLLIEENPQESLKMINHILENDDENVDAINQKGCILVIFEEYEKAIECFDRCLKLDKTYFYALFNKALILRMMNKLEESLYCFNKLLKATDDSTVKAYQLEILEKLHDIN